MNSLVLSHKPCWRDSSSASGISTDGGFPKQISVYSSLFGRTDVIVCRSPEGKPSGLTALEPVVGRVIAIKPPSGVGRLRKLGLIPWIAANGAMLWRAIRDADTIHSPVPGDIGAVASLIALAQRKKLFIRHCGTWGNRSTVADRFLAWLLPKVAGGTVVVMATGGGPDPPEPGNLEIQWIFATSLTEMEFEEIRPATPWAPGRTLRLATVGRLTREKNALACIEALPAIRQAVPGSSLAVVGDGPFRNELEKVVAHLDLDGAVVFHGNLNHREVLELLCVSHTYLFPTRVAEGFPKAVLEAMACGLPVIASPVSVLPHLLGDGCGVVLEGTGADDVAAAILDLVDDPGRMAAMGRKARERAGSYTLERWRDLIGERLEAAWGCRLKSGGGDGSCQTGAAS